MSSSNLYVKTPSIESEDELLASSQDTIVGSSGEARDASTSEQATLRGNTGGTSTPVLQHPSQKTPVISSSKARQSNATKPNKHSPADQLRIKYRKATFILGKIAENEKAGKVHERDAADKIKYQKVVEEFNSREKSALPSKKEKSTKRNRSLEEEKPPQKRTKLGGSARKETPRATAQPRALSEVVRDNLQVAIVDELSTDNRALMSAWNSIEAKLSELVFKYTISAKEGPYPSFDSGEMLRGYKVIRCADDFSRDFLGKGVAKISNDWKGLKLKLIPAREVPRKPLARILLPLMSIKPTGAELIRSLQRLNPRIPMNDWVVIKTEEPRKNSAVYLLRICEDSRKALEEAQCKLRFGIKSVSIKILQSQEVGPTLGDDIVEVDDVTMQVGAPGEALDPGPAVPPAN